MTELANALRQLGWKEDLIRAFTVGNDFPVVESAVTYTAPEVQCVDMTNLVIAEAPPAE